MKLTTGILVLGTAMAVGTGWAQNPNIIDNTRNTMKSVQQQKTADSDAALAASQGQASTTTGTPGKSAAAPGKSTSAKSDAKSATPPTPASKVASAAGQKSAVSAAPASTQSAHQFGPQPVKASQNKSISQAIAKANAQPSAKSVSTKAAPVSVSAAPQAKAANDPKQKAIAPRTKAKASKPAKKEVVAVQDKKSPVEPKKPAPKNYSAAGRRDPFVSPVMNRSMVGSGCSTGKRCLAIDEINLNGVVKSDSGMIAVVVNALNKAYFLRENDPVFNGYVVKITGDSIIFKQTLQDKLGKSFTREVTKKITTPAV